MILQKCMVQGPFSWMLRSLATMSIGIIYLIASVGKACFALAFTACIFHFWMFE